MRCVKIFYVICLQNFINKGGGGIKSESKEEKKNKTDIKVVICYGGANSGPKLSILYRILLIFPKIKKKK